MNHSGESAGAAPQLPDFSGYGMGPAASQPQQPSGGGGAGLPPVIRQADPPQFLPPQAPQPHTAPGAAPPVAPQQFPAPGYGAPAGSPAAAPQTAPVGDPRIGSIQTPPIDAPDHLGPDHGRAPSPGGTGAETADPDLVAALHYVIDHGCSDLHLTVGAPPMVRLDGALRSIPDAPRWTPAKISSALRSILSPEQEERFERELELDLAYSMPGRGRFRVNLYRQRDSMGAAFRLIPTTIRPLAELGLPESIAQFAGLPRGLVLVTGPTGSGKSTTLASLIDLVNETRSDHIMTVEDPIEFLHKHKKSLINQREVGADTHSFSSALKHVLRQDPDVVLVGEMRDLETISVALTAAETGHLVFATLHTQDAPQTIDRIIDVFPAHQQSQVRAQLAGTLQGIVCQTLIKKASGRGRVVASEVMMMTPAVANLIRDDKIYQIPSIMQTGSKHGMQTMDSSLATLVKRGDISYESGLEKAHDQEAFQRLARGGSTPMGERGR